MICSICGSDNIIKKGFSCNDEQRYKCNNCQSRAKPIMASDIEIVRANVKFKKQTQKQQDINRIERKSFREHARVENAIASYIEALKQTLDNNKLGQVVKIHNNLNNEAVAVVQVSDAHFNELVDLKNNKYDLKIASKRLAKFAERIKVYLQPLQIKDVLVVFTGDLMNSDRRMDELLNMATNRSRATFFAVNILKHFLLDLNEHFNISVACVTGNESRLRKEEGYTNMLASDNYDFTIFNFLKYIFSESGVGIKFFVGEDPVEQIINVAGQNVLFLHGTNISSNIEKQVQGIAGRYAARGIVVDYVIFGHKHSCRIGDNYARSSSLVGANAYSEHGLNLTGRASQNLYTFYKDGSRDGIKIDLQHIDGVIGYPIGEEDYDCYNPKSVSKILKKKVIMEIII